MDGWKIGDQGNESLKNPKLNVNALAHGSAHRVDDAKYCGMWNGLECDEALKRTQ